MSASKTGRTISARRSGPPAAMRSWNPALRTPQRVGTRLYRYIPPDVTKRLPQIALQSVAVMEIKRLITHFTYRIEPKPEGGFIAHAADPSVPPLEASTREEQ